MTTGRCHRHMVPDNDRSRESGRCSRERAGSCSGTICVQGHPVMRAPSIHSASFRSMPSCMLKYSRRSAPSRHHLFLVPMRSKTASSSPSSSHCEYFPYPFFHSQSAPAVRKRYLALTEYQHRISIIEKLFLAPLYIAMDRLVFLVPGKVTIAWI